MFHSFFPLFLPNTFGFCLHLFRLEIDRKVFSLSLFKGLFGTEVEVRLTPSTAATGSEEVLQKLHFYFVWVVFLSR